MSNVGNQILGFVLSIVKAFFSAVIEMAWGLASFFLLSGLITSYTIDVSSLTLLFKMIVFIQKNWLYFFGVFFVFNFAIYFKQFIKPITLEHRIDTIKNNQEVKL
jgi:hypothetical protein